MGAAQAALSQSRARSGCDRCPIDDQGPGHPTSRRLVDVRDLTSIVRDDAVSIEPGTGRGSTTPYDGLPDTQSCMAKILFLKPSAVRTCQSSLVPRER
mgnify:CR=1 FL=1